jgi:uncharacterized OB-fold protein
MTTVETSDGPALAPPMPEPDEITQFFWDGVNEHRLLILRCNACGHYVHLPREVCRFCLSTDLAPAEVSGRGTVETVTIPMQPFNAWFQRRVPYVLAVVELEEEEDLKLVTNIVDCDPDDVTCGMAVHVVFRQVHPDLILPLFAPDESPATNGGAAR